MTIASTDRPPPGFAAFLMNASITLLALLLTTAGDLETPRDWPQWRGPNHDGSVDASDLPTDFSKTEKVRWTVSLPGPGAGTPLVLGERVLVSSIDEAAGSFVAICLDRESGEERWRRKPDSGYRPAGNGGETWLHDRSNYASPSPVTDGERAVFFFGNGDLVAYDMAGEALWARNLQEDYGQFTFQWTFSASPTLWEETLFVQILQRDTKVYGHGEDGNPSFLLAIDPDTGETRFKHVRPSNARKESLESYATPTPFVGEDGRKELLIVGGDVVTGHDPATGAELWRWGGWNPDHREEWWRLVPSVVVGGGHALVCAPKRAPVFAVRLGGEGDLGEEGLVWQSEGRRNPVSSDVPTPLFYRDRFFVLSDVANALSRVHPATGEVEWTIELPGRDRWRSSPTGADGHIWCMDHAGDVVIVNPDDGSIENEIAMGEEDADKIRSSIAVAHDHLFIRTNTRLFCVGG
ncbi:MAG: hypothetical protein CMJ84_18835 [Planctomycetes bacterium]|nr:hypothetical protein [Planctomycetota bacterium]